MTRRTYDQACYVLARHFLGDSASELLVDALAWDIQSQIEDWLEFQKAEIEKEIARRPS